MQQKCAKGIDLWIKVAVFMIITLAATLLIYEVILELDSVKY